MRRDNINKIKSLIEEMRKGKKPAPKKIKKEEPELEVKSDDKPKRKKKIVKKDED